MNKLEKNFYLEIKNTIDYYLEIYKKAIENTDDIDWMDNKEKKAYLVLKSLNLSKRENDAIQEVVKSITTGVVHSLFVSIDGGTALSSEGKALELINRKTGEPLTKGALHENFVDVFE